MKKTILIFFFLLSINSNVHAGGGRNYNYIDIDVFEQTFNFYYRAVDDTLNYLSKKGKEKSIKATVNVTFYDIEKDSTFHLFDKSFNGKIVSFFYESTYSDSAKNLEFTKCDNYYGDEYIKNNKNILEREISEKVFIITYSFDKNKYTLWTCHKTGKNLKKFSEFDDIDNVKVDVFNKNILTINESSKSVTIDKKSY